MQRQRWLIVALSGAPKNHNQDCRDVAAAPVLTLDYIAMARRVADRRMGTGGVSLGGYFEAGFGAVTPKRLPRCSIAQCL
jgi:hypothetical protein